MKAGVALVVFGLLALFAQSVLTLRIPAWWLPDMGLLFVVAAAIGLRSGTGGVLCAALLGWATDCLSGSLLGQHMLLSMAVYGVARVSAAQLNLRGPLPQATFVAVLAAAHAAALWALVAFFSGTRHLPVPALWGLLAHALVSGLFAPIVIGLVVRLLAWLGEDDGQRPLRLEPRTLAP